MSEAADSSAMIRLATMEALNGEGARQVPLEAATRFNKPLSSAPKATWVCILGVTVGLLLFAPRAASKEEFHSYMAAPSFPPSPFTPVLLEPQATLNTPRAGSKVVETKGSHAVYVSQPEAVASLIEEEAVSLVSAGTRSATAQR